MVGGSVPVVRSERYDLTFKVRSNTENSENSAIAFIASDAFGFNSGGTADIVLSCSAMPGPINLIVFTDEQALKISSDAVQVCNLSNEEADFNAVRTVSFAMRNYTNVQQTFYFGNDLEPGFFKFGIQTCATSPMTVEPECTVGMVLRNPGGEHLSSDMVNLPGIYDSLTVFWAIIIGVWVANWLQHRKASNNLHKLSPLPAVFELISCALFAEAYTQRSADEDNTHTNAWGVVTQYIAMMFAFFLLLLISFGYCIIHERLDSENVFNVVAAPALACLSLILMRFVHKYFLAITVIFVVIVIISILKNTGRNGLILRARLMEIELTHPGEWVRGFPLAAPLLRKRFMIEGSRAIFTAYLVLWAMLGIFEVALKRDRETQLLLEELLEVFLVVSILWLVRLRDFRAFLPQANPNGGGAEEGDDAANTQRKPPCMLVHLPGKVDEAMCLGVEVNNDQVTAFLDSLRKPRTVE